MFEVSSEWFDSTEPFLTASSQEEQGVESNCTQIPGGSTAHPELEYRYPTHIDPLVKMWLEKV